jgi:hypothetical protein
MQMHSGMFDTNAVQNRLAKFFDTDGPSCTAEVSHGKLPFDGSGSLSRNGKSQTYRLFSNALFD